MTTDPTPIADEDKIDDLDVSPDDVTQVTGGIQDAGDIDHPDL